MKPRHLKPHPAIAPMRTIILPLLLALCVIASPVSAQQTLVDSATEQPLQVQQFNSIGTDGRMVSSDTDSPSAVLSGTENLPVVLSDTDAPASLDLFPAQTSFMPAGAQLATVGAPANMSISQASATFDPASAPPMMATSGNVTPVLLTPKMTSNTTPAPYVVIASSQYSTSWPTWGCFDQGGTFWESSRTAFSNGVGDAWIGIDLGGQRTLVRYDLTNRPSGITSDLQQAPKNWTIEASDDGANWRVVHTVVNAPIPTTFSQKTSYVLDAPATGRFFRMHVTQTCGPTINLTIGEIEFYGINESGASSPALLTQPMTSDNAPAPYAVLCSSLANGSIWPAWHAFDGQSAHWESGNGFNAAGVGNEYIGIDLGVARIITKYAITGREDYADNGTQNPRNWTAEGSNDGINWTILDTVTDYPMPATAPCRHEHAISSGQAWRYWRLHVTANWGNPRIVLSEIELYGTDAGVVPPPPPGGGGETVVIGDGEGVDTIYIPADQLPYGAISADRTSISAGESVTFTVTGIDPAGSNVNGINLDRAEGGYFDMSKPSHTYDGINTPNDGALMFSPTSYRAATHAVTFTKAGTYNFKGAVSDARLGWLGQRYSLPITITVNSNTLNAAYDSQSVPDTIAAGATMQVWVTMRNTGNLTWDGSCSLGSQNPPGNNTWGVSRVDVGSPSIAPGQTKAFLFTITAPTTPGSYNFQWCMQQIGGAGWFGTSSPNKTISVVQGNPPNVPIGLTLGSVGASSVRLYWNAPVGGPAVDHYEIYLNGNLTADKVWYTPDQIPYTVSGIEPMTKGTIAVCAVSAIGSRSAQSNAVEYLTPGYNTWCDAPEHVDPYAPYRVDCGDCYFDQVELYKNGELVDGPNVSKGPADYGWDPDWTWNPAIGKSELTGYTYWCDGSHLIAKDIQDSEGTYTYDAILYGTGIARGGGEIATAIVTVGSPSTLPVVTLDSISEGIYKDRSITGGGWAADLQDGAPVNRVELWIDGNYRCNVSLGEDRPDVPEETGHPDWRYSGFSFNIPASSLGADYHSFQVKAFNNSDDFAVSNILMCRVANRPSVTISPNVTQIKVGQGIFIDTWYSVDYVNGDVLMETSLNMVDGGNEVTVAGDGTGSERRSGYKRYYFTPTHAGTYVFKARAITSYAYTEGWIVYATCTVTVNDYNHATFVSQNVPASMVAGSSATVTVTMRNAGSKPWNNNSPYPYSLGSQNPQDNGTWGLGRVSVGDAPVQPGETKAFTFTITAPAMPGNYNFQWRMVQDGVEWFGDNSPNVVISVVKPSINANIPNCTTSVSYGGTLSGTGYVNYSGSYLDRIVLNFGNISTTATLSGNTFNFSIPVSAMSLGAHSFSAVAWGVDGSYTNLYTGNFTVVPVNGFPAIGYEQVQDFNGIMANAYYDNPVGSGYPACRTIGTDGTWYSWTPVSTTKIGDSQLSLVQNTDSSLTYTNRMSSGSSWRGNEAVLLIKDPVKRYVLEVGHDEWVDDYNENGYWIGSHCEWVTEYYEYFDVRESRDARSRQIKAGDSQIGVHEYEYTLEWRVVRSTFWGTNYGQDTVQSVTVPFDPAWSGKEMMVRAWAFQRVGADDRKVEFYTAPTRIFYVGSPPTVHISAKEQHASNGEEKSITAAMGERVKFSLSAADVDGDLRAINFWVSTPNAPGLRNICYNGSLNNGFIENTTTDTIMNSGGVNRASLGPEDHSFTITLNEGFGTYQFQARSRDSREISSGTAIINVQVDNHAPVVIQKINGIAQGNIDGSIGVPIPIEISSTDPDGNLRAVNLWVKTPTHDWRNIRADKSLNGGYIENATTDNFISSDGVDVPSLIGPKNYNFTPTLDEGVGVYQFTARGIDSLGMTSTMDVLVSVNVMQDNQPPNIPDGLSVSNITDTSFTLSWNSASGATGYEVLLNGSSWGTTTSIPKDITNRASGTAYLVKVRAYNSTGNYSDWSSPLYVTTTGLPQGWFDKHGPNSSDPLDPLGASSNGNGLSNIAEFNLGSSPGGSGGGVQGVPDIMAQVGVATQIDVSGTYVPGVTTGEFAVDKNGAATYSIPIAVTPGSGGMQPSISLEYSSANGSGIAGYGWSLAGLSSIVRCGQSMLLDGQFHALDFSYADRYIFDGQRLVAISGDDGCNGTEYRLESDNFTRIISYSDGTSGNGPTWFKAWTKSGLIVELGHTVDSAQKLGERPEVFTWQVNKISDTVGNYMTFRYDSSSGQQVVDRIDYTGNVSSAPYASIRFEYENRSDVMSGYIKGEKITSNKRLSAIKVFYEDQPVRTYNLDYTEREYNRRSILTSVTERGEDGKAYRPITFEYSDPHLGWKEDNLLVPPLILAGASNNAPLPPQGVAFVDLDGDGRVDCVQKMRWNAGSYTNIDLRDESHVWLNKAEGWVSASGEPGNLDYRLPDGCELSYHNSSDTGTRFVDINGDGLIDVINRAGIVFLNTGTGFERNANERFSLPYEPPVEYTQAYGGIYRERIEILDINGDGRPDIVGITTGYDGSGNTMQDKVVDTWINTGGGSENDPGSAWSFNPNFQVLNYSSADPAVRYIDLNGDGLTDVVYSWSQNGTLHKSARITGIGNFPNYYLPVPLSVSVNNDAGGYVGTEFVDLNGDGLPDIVTRNSGAGAYSRDMAYLNTGIGWVEAPEYKAPVALADGTISKGCVFMDINNDGLPDLVCASDSYSGAWLNTGTGWTQAPSYMNLQRQLYQSGRGSAGADLIDVNADGAVDEVWNWDGDGSSTANAYINRRVNPDKLTKVTSSLGVAVQVTYAPLAELDPQSGMPTVYEKDSNAVPPKADIAAPLYVVKTVSNDDGCGGTYDLAYRYGNLRAEPGRGSLGFEWMQVTDAQTGIKTKTYFSQDYHTIGMTTHLVTTAPDGVRLNESTSTLEWRHGPNDKVRFAYVAATLQSTCELNDTPTSTTFTTYEYDEYGNATSVVVDTSDGAGTETYKKTSTNTYVDWITAPSQDSLNCWMLGRLTRSTVTTEAPNVSTQTRTSNFEYDKVTGLLTKESIEPDDNDDPSLKITTTYEHDSFGNKTKATTTGFGLGDNGRTIKTTYDSQGRFPKETENAKGHKETYVYNQELGVIESQTGPNGITTKWEYDSFARQVKEIRAYKDPNSQTQTTTDYLWSTPAADLRSTYLIKTESSGSAPAITFFDNMGRAIAAWAVNPGDLDKHKQPCVVVTETYYDNYGRACSKSMPHYIDEPASHWSETFHHDILNRPLAIATPDDDNGEVISSIEYDGLVTRTTNPLEQVEETIKNTQGQIIKRVSNAKAAAGSLERGEISYKYDAYNNLLQTSVYREDGTAVETTFEYDKRGRKIKMIDPDMGTWYYSYNAAGELISQTDAKGQKTKMEYDVLGRMITRTDADGTVTTWTYDTAPLGSTSQAKGKLASLLVHKDGDSDYSETFEYDSLGRPVTHSMTIVVDGNTGGNTYTTRQEYDNYSRPTVMTYPDGFKVKNVYSALGFLTEVRAAGGTIQSTGLYRDVLSDHLFWKADSYTVAGAIDGAIYGNGLTYDAVISPISGRIQAITASVCDQAGAYHAINHLYEYDSFGQVTRRIDQVADRDERFYYDGLNRLVSYNINGGPATKVTYDALGNITKKSDVGNYYYDDPNHPHAVTRAGAQTYVYDDNNGNQISGPDRELEWSAANQIKKITNTKTNISTTFRFGAARERIVQERSDGTKTIYVGSAYEVVIHPGGLREEKCHVFTPLGRTATRTVRNDSKIETRYYHQDGLGSIVAVSDECGRIEERFAFDPWGSRIPLVNMRNETGGEITRGFTDHEMLDDFGIIHMNGRVFDPTLARFLSADPFVSDSCSSQAFNRYSYVENNPLNSIDPTGYWNWRDALETIAIVVAVAIVTYCTWGAGTAAGWSTFWAYTAAGAAGGFTSAFLTTMAADGSVWQGIKTGAVGGAIAALAAAATFGIGEYFSTHSEGIWANGFVKWIGKRLADAAVDGLESEASGGEFRNGFYSGLVADGGNQNGGPFGIVQAAIVGGTIAELNGGKFANGAITGAGAYVAITLAFELGTSGGAINSMSADDKSGLALAKHVYDKNYKDDIADAPGYHFTGDAIDHSSTTGLRGAVYSNGVRDVLVFRGSYGNWSLWKSNFLQALGFNNPLYTEAINYATSDYMRTKYPNLQFAGHSLGGGLAVAAALATGGKATVFNASGLSYNTIGSYNMANAHIVNYRSTFDLLGLGNALTPVIVPGRRVSLGMAGLHGVAGLVNAVETP